MGLRGIGWVLVAGLVLATGCGGGGGGGSLPNPTVGFFNASPDSPNVDFLVDDGDFGANNPFLSGTAFKSSDPDGRDLRALESGTTNEIDVVFSILNKDKHYLVALLGLVNFGSENLKRSRLTAIQVNRDAPIGNKARLYIFHGYNREAGFDTPNIDFKNPGDNPQFKAADIPPGQAQSILVDSGNVDYEVRRSGTDQVLIPAATLALGAGKIYGVYVVGVENGTGSLTPQIVAVEIPPE